jgi:hypothetical protein
MVDTQDLGSCAVMRAGSSPAFRTDDVGMYMPTRAPACKRDDHGADFDRGPADQFEVAFRLRGVPAGERVGVGENFLPDLGTDADRVCDTCISRRST